MLDSLAVTWGLWTEDASTLNGITPQEFNTLCERTVSEETETIVKLGIPADRAPMLAGAAAFYHALAVRTGADRIVIPRTGLMEGLLLTLPDDGLPWPPVSQSSG
jgi:exopolyphosphatase/pppGpp-phosphohydrolase